MFEKSSSQPKIRPQFGKPTFKSAPQSKKPAVETEPLKEPRIATQSTDENKAKLKSPNFINLQQEDKVYGTPDNLNLSTLYKMNPQLWDEFRDRFPNIDPKTPQSVVQPFFARFIQDYLLATISGTTTPVISWHEGAEDFNWRDVLRNPEYQEILQAKRKENRGWFIADLADWIQLSYIDSLKDGAPLPWLSTEPTITSSTSEAAPIPSSEVSRGSKLAPKRKDLSESPSFINLQQEDKVYGTPDNLNLSTLYKMNPQLWDEFRDRFPNVDPKTPQSIVQPFFARFIQDYLLATISGTTTPVISWHEGAEDFNWRDVLRNPEYQEILQAKRQENRGWFIADLADWIQLSYIDSLKDDGLPLPWLQKKSTPLTSSLPPKAPLLPGKGGPKKWIPTPSVGATLGSTALSSPSANRSSPSVRPSQTLLEQIQRFKQETLSRAPTTSEAKSRLSLPIFTSLESIIAHLPSTPDLSVNTSDTEVEEEEWDDPSETIGMTSYKTPLSFPDESREDTPRKLVNLPRLTSTDEIQLYSLLEWEHRPEKVKLDDLELETQQRVAMQKFNGLLIRFDAVIDKYENELSILENHESMKDEIQRLEQLNIKGSTSDNQTNRLLYLKQYYADYYASKKRIEEERAALTSLTGVKLRGANLDRKNSSPARPSVEEEIKQMEKQLRELKLVPTSSKYLMSVKERLDKERKKRAAVVSSHNKYTKNLNDFQTLRAQVVGAPLKENRIEQLEKEMRIYLADLLKDEINAIKPKEDSSPKEDFSQMLLKQRQRAGGFYDDGEESDGEESDSEDWFN